MISAGSADEVVQIGRSRLEHLDRRYDAAVVSDQLPAGARADVVITLPDTRGSGGTGTVWKGDVVQEVRITGAEQVIELLEQYLPRHTDAPR